MLNPLLHRHQSIKITLITLLSITIFSCSEPEQQIKAPPPAVSVYNVTVEEVGRNREFVARTQAFKEANLRARVEGELIERHFREGAMVEKGQLLLKIDPANYDALLSQAKADLASRVSGEDNATRNLRRAKDLIGDGYISQSDFDRLTTEESQAKASVKAAQAALRRAELDLGYTTILAPFTGRIGKVNYNVGNIVGPTSDALATLTITDPIYVSFQVEEELYLNYLQEHKDSEKPSDVKIDLSLRLPNNTTYDEQGQLDFTGIKIEQGMGTVELRASFANTNGIILPGLFVTLITESQKKESMSMVPQAAVQANQQGKFVLVVDESQTVKQRHVVLGRRVNAMWIVEKGLEAGEQVIIEGLQKVRPGVTVNPVLKVVDALTGTITEQKDEHSASAINK
ncbi:efflux RND transporter periplasmic adaptor subunit [Candidatus Colwellia aromaticivorans]|uniref:efflux RND transporter periplasmic adaptor subunit n=1 Tax=Candidatus Colwellia aromaticivorans TaxID=2267621 RepID=UPI000DF15C38|nr:efflux RND transporter periplasmic adaptor subunit [Candidatus Colwellia aromaticivorans]